ncbi:MAG: DUF4147 domain-containing protein, partial [Candidatus Gracilibacteria bacterium]
MNNKEILLGIAKHVLENCTPEKLLKGQLNKKMLGEFERIAVFSIGKAANGMARAIEPELKGTNYQILLANEGHPLPTELGVRNTEKIIKVARSLGEKD